MRRLALPLLLLVTACSRELTLAEKPPAAPAIEPFDVDPPFAAAAPGETVELELVGGTAPFAFESSAVAVQEPAAEGTIRVELADGAVAVLEGRTLRYTAPQMVGDFDEKIPFIDAAGEEATAEIRVGSALQITPTYAFVNASGRVSITATGGKPPYLFEVDDGALEAPAAGSTWLDEDPDAPSCPEGADPSPARTTSTTGGTLLVASRRGDSTVTVRDALGATAAANVVRGDELRLLQVDVELFPGESFVFTAVGGDPKHSWWLVPEGGTPGAPLPDEFPADEGGEGGAGGGAGAGGGGGAGGEPPLPDGLRWEFGRLTVEVTFVFPNGEPVTWRLRVEGWSWQVSCRQDDGHHRSVWATVTINPRAVVEVPPLELLAPTSLRAGGSVTLRAEGGLAPYSFAYVVRQNFSGGTVDAQGEWVAGRTPGVFDRVQVVDAVGTLVAATVEIVDPGVPGSAWQADYGGATGPGERNVPAFGRTLVSGGLVFALGDDGGLEVRHGPPGRLVELLDANDDGLTDVIVAPYNSESGLHLYVGTVGGDFVWAGGGLTAYTATLVRTETQRFGRVSAGPSWYVVSSVGRADGLFCPLASVTRNELLTGTPPQSCAVDPTTPIGTSPFVLSLGMNRVGVAAGGLTTWQLAVDGSLTPELSCAPIDAQTESSDPIVLDLDDDRQLDLARIVRDGAGRSFVQSCLSRIGELRVELPPGSGGSLFVGGANEQGRARLLVASSVFEGLSEPLLLELIEGGINGPMLEVHPFGVELSLVGAGDLDGDARDDLLFAEPFGTLRLLRGDPDGGFGQAVRVRVGPAGRYDYLAADLDDDGTDEAIATTSGFTAVFSATRRPDPARPGAELPALVFVGDTDGLDVAGIADAIDWRGDGTRELLGVTSDGRTILLPLDEQNFLLGAPSVVPLVATGDWGRPMPLRLRAEEAERLFIPLLGPGQVATGFVLLALAPDGTVVEEQRVAFPDGALGLGERLLVGDVDGDGLADLVAAGVHTLGGPLEEGIWVGRGVDEAGTVRLPASLAAFERYGGAPLFAEPGQRPLLADPTRHLVYRLSEVVFREQPTGLQLEVVDVLAPPPVDPPQRVLLPTGANDGELVTSLSSTLPVLVDLGRSTGEPEPAPRLELLVAAGTGSGPSANAIVAIPLGDDGTPLAGQERLLRLAPRGVAARWTPLRTAPGAPPDLAVSLEPEGAAAAPELLLLRNAFGPFDPSQGLPSPPPFVP